MNTQSPPDRRLWNIEGWGLRWKITAVLAIPLTVAMVLGGIRVQNELSRAMAFSSAADQVVDIPDIVNLGTRFGLASAGYSVNTMLPEDLDAVDQSLESVRTAAANPELPTAVAEQLNGSIAEIEDIQAAMRAGTPPSPDLPARTSAIRANLAQVVNDIVAPIEDPTVVAAHTSLVDAWSAQRRLADQVTGAIALLKNPDAPLTDLITATGAELAMIDTLANSFPDAKEKTDELKAGVRERLDMIDKAYGGALPLLELRASLVDSVDIYGTLLDEASDSISTTVQQRAEETRSAALRDAAIVLATLLAALVLALLVSRSLVGPIRRLRFGALQVARQDLPDAIDRVMAGDSDAAKNFAPLPVETTEEIGQLARAVDDIHGQALKLAGEQAELRMQISDMFETLARRSKSLVDSQLGLIESLEFEEKDPKRLESLFRLDHLAARMRRNGDNLLILSGTQTRRGHSAPVQLGDVVRAAMSEVEEYQRVQVGSTPSGALSGAVATDIVHLLAELLDNSLRASPPDTRVRITFARAVDGGVLLEVTDQGIGIPDADLSVINERLASGGQVGPETARHMGLFVASRLAARHGLTVRLRSSMVDGRPKGISASIHMPTNLLMSTVEMDITGPQVRLDTGGLPLTVVQSGEMPQLVAEPTQSAPLRLRPATAPASGDPTPTDSSAPATTAFSQPVPGGAHPVPADSGAPALPQRLPRTSVVPDASSDATASSDAQEPQVSVPVLGLPQRVPGATVTPPGATPSADLQGSVNRDAPALPQRVPGTGGPAAETGPADRPTPAEPSLPQRVPGAVVPPPARVVSEAPAAPTAAAPTTDSPARSHGTTVSGLPQRVPGTTHGLPQRTPGASGVPRRAVPDAAPDRRPQQAPAPAPAPAPVPNGQRPEPTHSGDPNGSSGTRHRYKSNPVKTASFFQNRPPAPPTQDVTATGTPIFSGMVSDWLTDPTDPGGSSSDWNTAADAGWRAAERAAGAPIDRHTETGLPQRTPGRRLVPGGVEKPEPQARTRNPEAVRDNLSRHQMGIRAGRAAGRAERNTNEGDR
ncbi:ATP-binding protein [Rhodococcus gannanensis]|uniref:histidine kinase n=1 Tax=Rhodococcus gannanensis TaxID=1960308 RepID=A0ABW4P1I5_9NOCA